jgi:hypothetical protein
MSQAVDEKQLCLYLLGKLGLEEQQRFEEQLMTQESLFDELQVLEDELIDGYLKGTLTPVDRQDFEKYFLSTPERQQKLQFAQAFRKHVAAVSKETKPSFWQSLLTLVHSQSPTFRYGLQAALSAAVVAGLWMAGTTWRLHNEVAQVRSRQSVWQGREQQLQQQLEEQRLRRQELEQQLTSAQAQTNRPPENPSAALVAFVLTPGLVRDSGTSKKVIITSETRLVELRLELADPKYNNYRVVLQDDKGAEILVLNKAKPQRLGANQFIVVTLSAKDLPGDYLLKLSGASKTGEFDPLDTYSFGVRRK